MVCGRGARKCGGRQPGYHSEQGAEAGAYYNTDTTTPPGRQSTVDSDSEPLESETPQSPAPSPTVRILPLQSKPNAPYHPRKLEMLRRIVSETKMSLHNVAAASALFYTLHTEQVIYPMLTLTPDVAPLLLSHNSLPPSPPLPSQIPPEESRINAALVTEGFKKLHMLDKENKAAEYQKDSHGFAIASDTGAANPNPKHTCT